MIYEKEIKRLGLDGSEDEDEDGKDGKEIKLKKRENMKVENKMKKRRKLECMISYFVVNFFFLGIEEQI